MFSTCADIIYRSKKSRLTLAELAAECAAISGENINHRLVIYSLEDFCPRAYGQTQYFIAFTDYRDTRLTVKDRLTFAYHMVRKVASYSTLLTGIIHSVIEIATGLPITRDCIESLADAEREKIRDWR